MVRAGITYIRRTCAQKRLKRCLGGELRAGMIADPDFKHPVDIGVIGQEQRIKRGIGIVAHIRPQPAVIIVVGLFIKTVKIDIAIRIQIIGLRRVKRRDIGPRVTGDSLRRAESFEFQRINDLLLENPRHRIKLGAFRPVGITGCVK